MLLGQSNSQAKSLWCQADSAGVWLVLGRMQGWVFFLRMFIG